MGGTYSVTIDSHQSRTKQTDDVGLTHLIISFMLDHSVERNMKHETWSMRYEYGIIRMKD